VPFPVVAAAASAAENSRACGTGVPSLTAGAAAARRATVEKSDAFMANILPCKGTRRTILKSKAEKIRFEMRGHRYLSASTNYKSRYPTIRIRSGRRQSPKNRYEVGEDFPC
jgi:hypothetical protein